MKLLAMNEVVAVFSGDLCEHNIKPHAYLNDCLSLRSVEALLTLFESSEGRDCLITLTGNPNEPISNIRGRLALLNAEREIASKLPDYVNSTYDKEEAELNEQLCEYIQTQQDFITLQTAPSHYKKYPFDYLRGNLKKALSKRKIPYINSLADYPYEDKLILWLPRFSDFIERLSILCSMINCVQGKTVPFEALGDPYFTSFFVLQDCTRPHIDKSSHISKDGLSFLLNGANIPEDHANIYMGAAIRVTNESFIEASKYLKEREMYSFEEALSKVLTSCFCDTYGVRNSTVCFTSDGDILQSRETSYHTILKKEIGEYFYKLIEEKRIDTCPNCGKPYIFTKRKDGVKSKNSCSGACRVKKCESKKAAENGED